MARRQPGKKLRVITVRGKQVLRDVEIRIMDDGMFFADLDGARYEDRVFTALEKKLTAAVLEGEKLTYKKIIKFELARHYESGNSYYTNERNEKWIRGFSFDFEVWEVADTDKVEHAGRHRLARAWLINDDGTLEPNGDFQKNYHNDWNKGVIAFTEERYQKLLKLRGAIIDLYNKLEAVLGDDAADKLAAMLDGKQSLPLLMAAVT
jgi:hypothetical protein